MSRAEPKKAKDPACAICARPIDPAYRPFCSRRCADEDLRRWLSGSYVVAGRVEDEGDGAGPAPAPSDED